MQVKSSKSVLEGSKLQDKVALVTGLSPEIRCSAILRLSELSACTLWLVHNRSPADNMLSLVLCWVRTYKLPRGLIIACSLRLQVHSHSPETLRHFITLHQSATGCAVHSRHARGCHAMLSRRRAGHWQGLCTCPGRGWCCCSSC